MLCIEFAEYRNIYEKLDVAVIRIDSNSIAVYVPDWSNQYARNSYRQWRDDNQSRLKMKEGCYPVPIGYASRRR